MFLAALYRAPRAPANAHNAVTLRGQDPFTTASQSPADSVKRTLGYRLARAKGDVGFELGSTAPWCRTGRVRSVLSVPLW